MKETEEVEEEERSHFCQGCRSALASIQDLLDSLLVPPR